MADLAPTPAPAPEPAPAPATEPWFASFPDELKGYVANKGLDKLDQTSAFKKVAEFHQNAESRLGIPADRVLRKPGPDSSQADWDAFYTNLGRPEAADKYELPVTDANKERANAFAQAAFKAGMPKEKAQAAWKELTDHEAATASARADAEKVALTNEKAELEKSWGKGADFQAKKLVALRAAQAAGVTEEQFESAANKPGFAAMWNLFLFFGQKTGEDKFIPGGIGPSNVYTREQALAEVRYYRDLNHEKGKALKANNPEAWTNYRALLKIAYPEGDQRRSA